MEIQKKISIIKDFINFCKENLNIESLPEIEFITDNNWSRENRSFGQYMPTDQSIKTYISNRNLADILRTLSHELVHHKQNELGLIKLDSGQTGSEIENQANSISGILMRKYGKTNELIYESKLIGLMEDVRTSTFNIYCDMDGVLCDFEAQFDHYYGIPVSEYRETKGPLILKKAIDNIGIDFWAKMPWFPGGQELWSYITKYNTSILTSPSTFEFAKPGKLLWIKNNLNPAPAKINFEQSREKQNVISALSPEQKKKSILIDDFYTNIKPWQESGGIGIMHKSAQQTITILKKFRL